MNTTFQVRAVGHSIPGGSLQRVLGSAFATSVAVGATIGGGILYTPGSIAALLPNSWLYMAVWIIGGINALLGATAFAELGAMIPNSGGSYPFARRAFGEYAGFFVGYTVWIVECASNAALLLLVGEYAVKLVPNLSGHATVAGLMLLATVTALNWRCSQAAGRLQILTTLAKTITLLGLVVAAFCLPHADRASTAAPLTLPQGGSLAVAFILAMQGVIFAYDSYYCTIFFSEEVKDPGRQVPRAMFRGLALIIGIFLALNAAYLWVLPIGEIANQSFVAAKTAEALFGVDGSTIMSVIVVVSMLGAVNATVMITARVLLAMGRDGLCSRHATRVNAGGTPTVATGLSTLMTAGFLGSGTFDAVLGVVAILMAVNYLVTYLSLIVLRRREPDAPRPYRAWGYPWTTIAALLMGAVFICGVALNDRPHSAIALVILLASYPLFRVSNAARSNVQSVHPKRRGRRQNRCGATRPAIPRLAAGIVLTTASATATAIDFAGPANELALRQARADAWWTGPLLASNAETLPKGHVLIEPYLYDTIRSGRFTTVGARVTEPREHTFTSLTYLYYGATNRLQLGLIPRFDVKARGSGARGSSPLAGDFSLQAQYRLTAFSPETTIPTISLVLMETLPTGRYDRLDTSHQDAFGSGTSTMTAGVYSQHLAWLPNSRLLRTRLNLSYSWSETAIVEGHSVYGTPTGFSGRARPARSVVAIAAAEYSMTQRWVLALDVYYEHDGDTRVRGKVGGSAAASVYDSHTGSSYYVAMAPAVEFNWNANIGIIAGVQFLVAGCNTAATLTPQIAINQYF